MDPVPEPAPAPAPAPTALELHAYLVKDYALIDHGMFWLLIIAIAVDRGCVPVALFTIAMYYQRLGWFYYHGNDRAVAFMMWLPSFVLPFVSCARIYYLMNQKAATGS